MSAFLEWVTLFLKILFSVWLLDSWTYNNNNNAYLLYKIKWNTIIRNIKDCTIIKFPVNINKLAYLNGRELIIANILILHYYAWIKN